MAGVADDDMIQKFDFQKPPRMDEVAGDLDVGFARRGFSARVVVLCDVRSYVQCRVFGAHIPPASTAKGMLWTRMSRPSRANPTSPAAC